MGAGLGPLVSRHSPLWLECLELSRLSGTDHQQSLLRRPLLRLVSVELPDHGHGPEKPAEGPEYIPCRPQQQPDPGNGKGPALVPSARRRRGSRDLSLCRDGSDLLQVIAQDLRTFLHVPGFPGNRVQVRKHRNFQPGHRVFVTRCLPFAQRNGDPVCSTTEPGIFPVDFRFQRYISQPHDPWRWHAEPRILFQPNRLPRQRFGEPLVLELQCRTRRLSLPKRCFDPLLVFGCQVCTRRLSLPQRFGEPDRIGPEQNLRQAPPCRL